MVCSKMFFRGLAWAYVALSSPFLFAQNYTEADCERNLDVAKQQYEQGALSEVAPSIDGCLRDHKFRSKHLMMDGYRLLTEAHLFQNDINKATDAFENLLRYNPLFEVDSTDKVASFDLIYLSQTYQRRPLFCVYGGLGINYLRNEILQDYRLFNYQAPVEGEAAGTPLNSFFGKNRYNYGFTPGFNFSLGLEVPLPYNLEVGTEVAFSRRTYLYGEVLQVSNNVSNPSNGDINYGSLNFKENQNWIDIPLFARYYIPYKKNILPYAYLGGGVHFLLGAELANMRRTTPDNSSTGEEASSSLTKAKNFMDQEVSLRTKTNWSGILGVGCKIRLDRNYLFIDLRYNRFFKNSINRENRYFSNELIYNYAYVDSDLRIDNLTLTVGFVKAFYQPRKKRKYDPIRIERNFDKLIKRERKNLTRETNEDTRREMTNLLNEMQRDAPVRTDAVKQGRVGSELYREAKLKIKTVKGN